jgi:hypothetical protein
MTERLVRTMKGGSTSRSTAISPTRVSGSSDSGNADEICEE